MTDIFEKLTIEVRDEIIRRGLEEIQETYDEDNYRRIGAEVGFELCRSLETKEQYERVLKVRANREFKMKVDSKDIDMDEYWKSRYVTLQIEFMYQRLLVLWGSNYLSTRAVEQVHNIITDLASDLNQ